MTNNLYKLRQPNHNIDIRKILDILHGNEKTEEALKKTENPQYLHWKDLKYKNWIPCDKEEFWAAVKFSRRTKATKTPIRDELNKYFTWSKLSHYEQVLHEITLDKIGRAHV